MKYDVFKKEINYIVDNQYQNIIKEMLEGLPDYFYQVPASSTGKYHPSFTLNSKGLVRHTKVAVKIAYDLLNNNSIGSSFNNTEKDLIIMALLVHDGFKYGKTMEKYTRFDHPLIASEYVLNWKQLKENGLLLSQMIASHMGPWNQNQYSSVILPTPKNKLDKFVHMCDYLASRVYLDVSFENDNIVEERG